MSDDLICDNCGELFFDLSTTHRIKGNRKFCCYECRHIFFETIQKKIYEEKKERKRRVRKLFKDISEASHGMRLLWPSVRKSRMVRYGQLHIAKKEKILLPPIEKGSCCTILKSHAELLKHDSERLSTDFIKRLSHCDCDENTQSN